MYRRQRQLDELLQNIGGLDRQAPHNSSLVLVVFPYVLSMVTGCCLHAQFQISKPPLQGFA